MSASIYYFSGSGNSLKVAKDIAEGLGDAALIPMVKALAEETVNSDEVTGIVFPVYSWGIPRMVLKFVKGIKTSKYLFAVITYGGSTGFTMQQLERLLEANSVKLNAGFEVQMPDCYIPMFDAHSQEEQQRMFRQEKDKVNEIVSSVNNRENVSVTIKKTLMNYILSGVVYKAAIKYFSKSDKNFWVKEGCNSCGICRRVCPVQNVSLKDGRPSWSHNCEACMACIQWCPKEAIQYGKKSEKRKRYHNPDIKINEMFLND
ncbi:MAG: EFR1 family ferrodoxin [Bacillota bacterium]